MCLLVARTDLGQRCPRIGPMTSTSKMSTQSDPNKVLGALQIGSTKLNATAHINRQCKDNNGSVKIIMEVNLTRTYRDNNVQCENSTKEPAIIQERQEQEPLLDWKDERLIAVLKVTRFAHARPFFVRGKFVARDKRRTQNKQMKKWGTMV
ncbi:hypothetical protein JHK82_042620 [Glycine max]|nr:hypothetical protein JHK82_042620 [Glycine max]KAG5116768.1 hypothetical protein JHK84_042881 [Glycine max]